MPLRDHFRPPVWTKSSWEGFHGGWPMTIVQELSKVLPDNFTAEPRIHLGSLFEIDVCAYEDDEGSRPPKRVEDRPDLAMASWTAPEPTLVVDADLTEQYEYEVLIYDHDRARELVAAIEIVSPGNKDRPSTRQAFVAKCAAWLQKRICLSIVDLVATRHFNLYCELLDVFGQSDPTSAVPSSTYPVTCRGRKVGQRPRFETWAYPLVVGQPLPVLPIWLDEDMAVSLNLETPYEEACRVLRLI